MFAAIRSCWALFFGLGLIMMGNGMQGTLLGIRANIEGFSVSVTSFVLAGYFLGYLTSALFVPQLIRRVGHVRIFGALASMASISILVHVVFIDPWIWFTMRVVTGMAYAGLYIVCESWVNAASTNENRGKMMSVYMLVMMGSVVVATFGVNLADPEGFELFALISVLVSFAVVPILISVSRAPDIDESENAPIRMLWAVSPLALFGMFLTTYSQGTAFSMASVYGGALGFSVKEITFMIAAYMIGPLISLWPVGQISDRFDRREVLMVVAFLSFIVAAFTSQFQEPGWQLYAAFLVYGAISQPMYSLCIAHMNDYLSPPQMVAASGTMVLVGGVGAFLGLPTVGAAMDIFGPASFLWIPGCAYGVIGVFALWRMTQRASVPIEDQADHVIMSANPINAVLNPEVDASDWDPEAADQPGTVEELFEEFLEPEDDSEDELRGESDEGD